MDAGPVIARICKIWAGIKSVILGVQATVADGEPLSRYLLSSRWLDKSDPKKPRLKPEIFIAHPDTELSVYRISGWDENKIRSTGITLADEREQKHKAQQLERGNAYPDVEGKNSRRSIVMTTGCPTWRLAAVICDVPGRPCKAA